MNDTLEFIEVIFDGAWKLFTSVDVPGFGISAAKVCIGFFVIKWSLNLLSVVTGFRTNAASAAYGLRGSHESAKHYKNLYDKKVGKNS